MIRFVAACIIAAIPLLAAAPASSQTSSVAPAATGKVVGSNNQPLAGVPLQVQGPQGKTVIFTDAQGKWSLYNLPDGTYHVGAANAAAAPVEFAVKNSTGIDKLFGGQNSYNASDIKIDK
jgi:hypothetical protein